MKIFPIHIDRSSAPDDQMAGIPWALIEPHRAQAQKNHGQSLEDLVKRGGLSKMEAVAVIEDKDFYERWPRQGIEWVLINQDIAIKTLKKHIAGTVNNPTGRALELNHQWRALPEKDRDYALGFFLGGCGCVGYMFTCPHRDQAHARWALDQFEAALVATRKQNADHVTK